MTHELSATYEIDGGRFINLPTVIDGQQRSDEEVMAAFRAGHINPLVDPVGDSVYGSLEHAVAGAKWRSETTPMNTLLGGILNGSTVINRDVPKSNPGFWETLWAGLEKESIFGTLMRASEHSRVMHHRDPLFKTYGGGIDEFTAVEPHYDPVLDPQVEGRLELLLEVLGSETPYETALIIRQYDHLQELNRVIGQDPVSFFGMVAGGFLNPSTFVPFAGVAKNASRFKRLAYGIGAGALAVAPEEALQSGFSPGRSTAESLWVIGGSAVAIGGLNALFGRRTPSSPKGSGRLGEGATGESSGRLGRTSPEDLRNVDWSTAREEIPVGDGSTVGAMQFGGIRRSFAEELRDEGLVETGTGLEKLGWNPVFRLLASASPTARSFVSDLVDTALVKAKNLRGIETGPSVESQFRTNWLKPLFDSIEVTDLSYLNYVARATRGGGLGADTAGAPLVQAMGSLKQQFSVLTADIRARTSRAYMTSKQFREEVGKAMRNGDRHEIPEVARAAQAWRRNIVEPLKARAMENDLFTRRLRKTLDKLEKRAAQLHNMANSRRATAAQREVAAADLREVADELAQVQEKIRRIQEEGPTTSTSESYFTRIWRHDKVLKDRAVLRDILAQWLASRDLVPVASRIGQAEDLIDHILQERTYLTIDRSRHIEERAETGALRERMIEVPDRLVQEFLENDVETVLRHHTRTLGMDIELSQRFGDIDLRAQLDAVKEEFDDLIKQAPGHKRAGLQKERAAALRDLEALRDRLRGTYGVPNDPYRPISRALRMMKSFNVITMMGGATVSAIPDIARVLMADGYERGMGAAFRSLWGEQAKLFRAMSRDELRAAGEGLDIVLGIRALQMADVGDVFGRRFSAERGLTAATGAYFLVNGLHMWNTMLKEWAGTVTGIRINMAAHKWAAGTLDEAGIAKMAASGIDRNMAVRISEQTRKFGTAIDRQTGAWIEDTQRIRNPDRYDWLPNTDEWSDVAAARAYRLALSQDVNRIIVTPGAGDRALWTSNEFGSTIAQFKSFSQGATQRVLVRGLQERDANFYMGVGMLIALGGVVNEIKSYLFGDKRSQPVGDKLVNAIDRSGVLGWFMDANNSIERLADYKVGLRPLLGGSKPYNASTRTVLGALGGPTGSQLDNVRKVMADVSRGTVNQYTAERASRLTPGANLFYLQALARMYETGSDLVNGEPE